MWKKLKSLCIKYREFLMYLVFGVATTLVDALIYFPIVYLFVGKTPAQSAQIEAWRDELTVEYTDAYNALIGK